MPGSPWPFSSRTTRRAPTSCRRSASPTSGWIGPRKRSRGTGVARDQAAARPEARDGGKPRRNRAGPGGPRLHARSPSRASAKALKLQREIGDKAGISTTLINLAALLNENLGRPDDALPLLREALQIRRDVGNTSGEALVLNNIGSVYFQKGQYSEGQTYFERAFELREKARCPTRLRTRCTISPKRSTRGPLRSVAGTLPSRARSAATSAAIVAAPRSSRTASARFSTTRAGTVRPSSRRKRRSRRFAI